MTKDMHPVRKILPAALLLLLMGTASMPCRGQFFWLGFQGGAGATWFSRPGEDSTSLSPGAGASFGVFIRYGSRPYFQFAAEWLFSTNQMKFQVRPDTSAHDNVPFHNFKLPFTLGYEVIHRPRFKLRAGGGFFIGRNIVLSSNSLDLTAGDTRNPQFGLVGEAGIQYLNFLVVMDYNYSFNRFFAKDASTYGVNVRSHLQTFSVKLGMQF
jgi:hypothetical protein